MARLTAIRRAGVVVFAIMITGCSAQQAFLWCDKTTLPATPGVNVTGIQWKSASAQGALLDKAKNAGAVWIRLDVCWDYIEQSRGSFTWKSYDDTVSAIQSRGLKVLLTLNSPVPVWAQRSVPSGVEARKAPPRYAADYGDFAKAVAQHYASRGLGTFEIWNEENHVAFWSTGADPVFYTAMLKDAATKIRSVNSKAVIILGGMAPTSTSGGEIMSTDFLADVYKAGGGAYFDAVADHPYTYPSLASDSSIHWGEMYHLIWNSSYSIRTVMHAHGDDLKKVWATEAGAPVATVTCWQSASGCYISPTQQAALIADEFNTFRKLSWMGPTFIYNLEDGTSGSRDDSMGLLYSNGSPKPSYTTFQNAAATWRSQPTPTC